MQYKSTRDIRENPVTVTSAEAIKEGLDERAMNKEAQAEEEMEAAEEMNTEEATEANEGRRRRTGRRPADKE